MSKVNEVVEASIQSLWSDEEYLLYLGMEKDDVPLEWEDITEIMNKVYHPNAPKTCKQYRDKFYKLRNRKYDKEAIEQLVSSIEDKCKLVGEKPETTPTEIKEIFEEKKKRYKASDELIQANAYIRRLSREETILEIARDVADKFGTTRLLDTTPIEKPINVFNVKGKSGILMISDWHVGLDFSNHWNTFNIGIAVERLNQLKKRVINAILDENIKELYVNNLGDLIAGRIHLTIRLESRIDTITQIITVSEMLAEFLNELSKYTKIKYYDCNDNHSRVEPNKANSLDLESLSRITTWFLAERLKDNTNITINTNNTFGDDIIDYTCRGFRIAAVHGDKDSPNRVVSNISLMTQEHFDMILTSHLHHFSADEQNETLVISNGSMMGTDTYAKNLRLCSKPSQNLIIVTDDYVCEKLYRIELD